MKGVERWLGIFILTGLAQLTFAQEAYAYLDPGSGSYILQILIAAFVGGLFFLKTFWRSMRAFFANLFSSKKDGGKEKGSGKK